TAAQPSLAQALANSSLAATEPTPLPASPSANGSGDDAGGRGAPLYAPPAARTSRPSRGGPAPGCRRIGASPAGRSVPSGAMHFDQPPLSTILDTLRVAGVRILIIVIVALVAFRLSKAVVHQILQKMFA